MRKRVSLFVFIVFLSFYFHKTKAQGSLQYFGKISVQRMPDGSTFRFLKGGDAEDTFIEDGTYIFQGIEKGDTVVWQYVEAEDQLYIASWNPSNSNKKHAVKFAILWHITSSNPRYGSVKVPAGMKFEGFGHDRMYFINEGNQRYSTLFFYTDYVPGLQIVNYTLKWNAEYNGYDKPLYEYAQLFDNYNHTDVYPINPFGPAESKNRRDKEEFERDADLSPALQAIKMRHKDNKTDSLWDYSHILLQHYDNRFYWDGYTTRERDFFRISVFIEDKYCTSKILNGEFVSSHPELVKNKSLSFEPNYHENGVTGWTITYKTLPMLHLKLEMNLNGTAPVLVIDNDADFTKIVKDYFLPETYYKGDKIIADIVAAKDPYERSVELWAEYAMEHEIECSIEEINAAIKSANEQLGMSLDYYDYTYRSSGIYSHGTVNPKYQDLLFVVISPNAAKKLSVRLDEGKKWNDVTLDEWDNVKGQKFRIFSSVAAFPIEIESYDYQFEKDEEAEKTYVMFFSKPPKK
ncbi:MAG: hypothetical protein POELPBGB_00938 [Bacteroidia bacterium]|nr:hypothetical protein [Bacteroidia bacterium]